MAPYLPQNGGTGGGSPYSEGGALYVLGLIRANHDKGIKQFLLESLRNTSNEVIQHGACLGLGLGLVALGIADEELYEDVKNVLYTDSAIAGEAVRIAMGLPMVGTASEKAAEMLAYAHDTQYEKIIRGLAIGIALVVYGREEEADTLIEQMTRDQDPILQYGGMYTLAMAYRGTANNSAIRLLLHFAVSDVNDDLRCWLRAFFSALSRNRRPKLCRCFQSLIMHTCGMGSHGRGYILCRFRIKRGNLPAGASHHRCNGLLSLGSTHRNGHGSSPGNRGPGAPCCHFQEAPREDYQ